MYLFNCCTITAFSVVIFFRFCNSAPALGWKKSASSGYTVTRVRRQANQYGTSDASSQVDLSVPASGYLTAYGLNTYGSSGASGIGNTGSVLGNFPGGFSNAQSLSTSFAKPAGYGPSIGIGNAVALSSAGANNFGPLSGNNALAFSRAGATAGTYNGYSPYFHPYYSIVGTPYSGLRLGGYGGGFGGTNFNQGYGGFNDGVGLGVPQSGFNYGRLPFIGTGPSYGLGSLIPSILPNAGTGTATAGTNVGAPNMGNMPIQSMGSAGGTGADSGVSPGGNPPGTNLNAPGPSSSGLVNSNSDGSSVPPLLPPPDISSQSQSQNSAESGNQDTGTPQTENVGVGSTGGTGPDNSSAGIGQNSGAGAAESPNPGLNGENSGTGSSENVDGSSSAGTQNDMGNSKGDVRNSNGIPDSAASFNDYM